MILLTSGIVVIGGLTAYIFLGQADIMQGQLEEMRGAGQQTERLIILNTGQLTQTERQVTKLGDQVTQFSRVATASEKANKITQDNAQRALQTSIDNSRLDERPWILPLRFDLSAEPEVDKPITVKVSVQNTGKTPGIHWTNRSRLAFWNVEPPINDPGAPSLSTSEGIIPPGYNGIGFITEPLRLNSTQVSAYRNGLNKIYLHARMDYRDGFTASKPHWTTICVYHQFGMLLNEFELCLVGNDVDHHQ
jgi:hypothetical protein